jgi:hypothetical protein
MDQEREIDAPADETSKMPARKHWHAPRFFVTEVLETSGACTCGGTETPLSSS